MYVPLDVNFPDDDKIEWLGMAEAGVYVTALCIAKRLNSDGVVTRKKLLRYGATDEQLDALVSVGLMDDDGDALTIVAWLKHNDSAQEVDELKASMSTAGGRGNHFRWHEAKGIVKEGCKWCAKAQRARTSDRGGDRVSESGPVATPTRPESQEVDVDGDVEVQVEVKTPAPPETGLVLHDVSLSAVAPAARSRREYPDAFEDWWNAYPLEFRKGKGKAHDEWRKAKANMPEAQLLEVIRLHAAAWDAKGERFVPNPATWLHQRRYDDPPPVVGSRRVRSDRQQRNDTILEDFVRGAG